MTDAPDTAVVSPVATMKAESERRLSLLAAANGKPQPKAESAKVEKPEGKSAAAGSEAERPVEKPGSASTKSDAVAAEDLSFVDEEFRSFFEKAPKSLIAKLRAQAKERQEGELRWKDYTQKTTEVAEAKKVAEARKQAADFGDAIMSDEEALEALRSVSKKRREGQKPASVDVDAFDFSKEHSPDEWKAYFDARDRRVQDATVRSIRGEQESETQQEAQALAEKREMANAAKAAFIDTSERSADEIDALYVSLVNDGVKFTKDNVVATLRKYLPAKAPAVKPAPQDSPHESEKPSNGSSGASSLSRSAGVSPTLTTPAFIRDGKTPSDRDERLAAALFKVNQRRVAEGKQPLTR